MNKQLMRQLILSLAVAILLPGHMAIAQQNNLSQKENPLTSQFTLSADKLYQVAFVAPKTESVSNSAASLYFGNAEEIAVKCGAQPLVTFDATAIEHGDIEVSNIVLIEWPSLEAVQALQNDARWVSTRPHRDLELADVSTAFFQVAEDVVVDFHADGLYEFAGFWMNRHNAELMSQYFKNMAPIVKLAAPHPLIQAQVVKTQSPYDLRPDRLNLLKWTRGAKARKQIFHSQEFKDNGYLRALALDRLLTVMVKPDYFAD